MMDFAAISVVLLDERVTNDRFESGVGTSYSEPKELLDDIQSLLHVFNGGEFSTVSILCHVDPKEKSRN